MSAETMHTLICMWTGAKAQLSTKPNKQAKHEMALHEMLIPLPKKRSENWGLDVITVRQMLALPGYKTVHLGIEASSRDRKSVV